MGVYSDPRYLRARDELRRRRDPCSRCGHDIDYRLKHPHPLSFSADHVIPKSKLPPGDPRLWHISNLAAAHLRCNESRGNKIKAPPARLPW